MAAFNSTLCGATTVSSTQRIGKSPFATTGGRREISFRDLGRLACGPVGAYTTDVVVLTCQFGGCSATLAFVANNLGRVFGLPRAAAVALPFLAVTALTLLRSTALLVPRPVGVHTNGSKVRASVRASVTTVSPSRGHFGDV